MPPEDQPITTQPLTEQKPASEQQLATQPAPDPAKAKEDAAIQTHNTAVSLILKQFGKDLSKPAPEEKKEEVKPEPKPAVDQPKPAKKSETMVKKAAPAITPELLKTEIQSAVAPLLAKVEEQKAPPAPTPEQEKEPEEDLSSWSPEEVELLEIAKFAEAEHADKHKGLVSQVKGFKAKLADYVSKQQAEDPDWQPQGEDFERYVETIKPKLSPVEVKRLEREMVKKEAVRELASKPNQELEELRRKVREIEAKPAYEQSRKSFANTLMNSFEAEEDGKPTLLSRVAKRTKEVGWEAAQKEFPPMHIKSVVAAVRDASSVADEMLAVHHGLKPFDSNNPTHQYIANLINYTDSQTAAQPEAKRTRTVKDHQGIPRRQTFVPMSQYYQIAATKPDQLINYWTHDEQYYAGQIVSLARARTLAEIEQTEADLAAAGYERKVAQKAQDSKQSHAPEASPEVKSPKSTPSLSPGAAKEGAVTNAARAMSNAELKALGLVK